MMKGDLIMEKLRSLVGEQQIEDLPIPFTAVATDIVKRKEVWLSSGDLFIAIRASMAIPGLFTPQQVGGRTLVDGGLLNPVPVAPATDNHNDLVIAVSLAGAPVVNPLGPPLAAPAALAEPAHRSHIESFLGSVQSLLGFESNASGHAGAALGSSGDAPADPEKGLELTMSDVLIGVFDTMQTSISRYRLAAYPPDLLIEIPENICDPHDFHRARELVQAGHYWTEQYLARHGLD